MSTETSALIGALVVFLFWFGPAILRVLLKPEKGSVLDLRIAWFETFVNDVEKRTKIREKLTAALLARLAGKPDSEGTPSSPPHPAASEDVPPAPPEADEVPEARASLTTRDENK